RDLGADLGRHRLPVEDPCAHAFLLRSRAPSGPRLRGALVARSRRFRDRVSHLHQNGSWRKRRARLPLCVAGGTTGGGAVAGEIVTEAARALLRAWPVWIAGGAAAFGLWICERRLLRARRVLHGALVATAVGLGLYFAWRILWLADDAFISFRYARNFARGLGLVYNEGEWVEGYTNFLWTLLLGLAGKLGLDIPLTALFGNLACFVAAIVLVAYLAARLSPGRPAVPFAALALALSKPFYTFASGGLETMPIALLAVAAVAAGLGRRGELGSGLILTTSVMCRPDQLLLYAAMGIALVAEDLVFEEGRIHQRLRLRRYLLFAAPFAFLYVPYFLWRWKAYGALL